MTSVMTSAFAFSGVSECHNSWWGHAKSLYVSRAMSYFYETEFEIWAGIGSAGSFSCLINIKVREIKKNALK